MTQFNQQMHALVSELAGDPDVADLVEMFVSELPDRMQAIRAAVEQHDRDTLTRLAHQLKGAAGGYGFPLITAAAMALEQSARGQADVDGLIGEINALAELCTRASARAPASN